VSNDNSEIEQILTLNEVRYALIACFEPQLLNAIPNITQNDIGKSKQNCGHILSIAKSFFDCMILNTFELKIDWNEKSTRTTIEVWNLLIKMIHKYVVPIPNCSSSIVVRQREGFNRFDEEEDRNDSMTYKFICRNWNPESYNIEQLKKLYFVLSLALISGVKTKICVIKIDRQRPCILLTHDKPWIYELNLFPERDRQKFIDVLEHSLGIDYWSYSGMKDCNNSDDENDTENMLSQLGLA
jgi:hypothetical protein